MTALSSGSYSLTVVDAFDCKSEVFSFEVINQDNPINLQVSVLNDAQCFGDSTGRLTARALNGELPLDYNWSSGEKTITQSRIDTVENLIAGLYNLTITDNEGCIGVSDSILIVEPSELIISNSKTDNLCSDEALGSATVDVSGGVAPYTVLWNNSNSGFTIDGLVNGSYTAQITDERGCEIESSLITITSPSALEVIATVEEPQGQQGGSIDLEVTGGIAPFNYSWPPPFENEVGSSLSNLPIGSYSVTISDQNGCSIDTLFVLQTNAVGDAVDEGFNFYPNPSIDILNISGPESLRTVELLSISGHTLFRSYERGPIWRIDLESVPVGLYYARCTLEDGRILYSDLLTKF